MLALAALFLVACDRDHRKQAYSGDWRQLRRAEKDNRWGYIDHSGKFAIEPQFVDEGNFSEGLAWVVAPKRPYGYIDKTGAWAVKPQFSYAMDFSEGLAAVSNRDKKWGFHR